mmetsp:Transcript_34347/g.71513  ORF Transcript_34347/g.71513 Transcript_34347/m.71513 type:complete len:502 (-) Transcript_34347:761-2266(-)
MAARSSPAASPRRKPQHASGTPSSSDANDVRRGSALWHLVLRLRVFVLGILMGVFVIRPFTNSALVLSELMSHSPAHEEHSHQPPSHFSKHDFLQASVHNTTRKQRDGPPGEPLEQDGAHLAAKKDQERDDSRPTKATNSDLVDDASSNSTNTIANTTQPEIVDFERQPHVVVATTIHGPGHMKQLIQSMCLFTMAYNNRPKYDVIVFVTEPISTLDESILRDVIRPANLQIVLDSKSLQGHIRDMSKEQLTHLMSPERCNVTSPDQLFWWTRCCEVNLKGGCMPLSYTWQSEFRSLHLWTQPVLKPYKYMLWLDSDAFCTRTWTADPIAVMIRNDLNILFDNFPMGSSAGVDLKAKIKLAYNESLCQVKLSKKTGHLVPQKGHCVKPRVPNIHGFFHITNLDFYRNAENLNWSRIMIGDSKFSRVWDDQLAVTVPAAIREPHKSWDMRSHNVSLMVYHNSFYDGQERWRGGGFQVWWRENAPKLFPEARDVCQPWIRNGG